MNWFKKSRTKLSGWLDDRTGYRDLVNEALYENIPGGSRWRYVWGSTLVFTFTVQMITGLFLWMAYSPSSTTAWESVYYIQYEMQGGWLLRGIHHFTAQAMIVLLALHFCQVVIDRAYKAPREVNFWLGLVLMMIVMGLSLTGYLLPWDQKGFYGTRVATELMGSMPIVGSQLQQIVVGGSDYGHATLTRFFALHAGLLPALLVAFLVLHIKVFRRHGIKAIDPDKGPDHSFWPDQILKDAVACLAVLAVVLFFVIQGFWGDHGTAPTGSYMGAELGAPADPANSFPAARPEWYFLFMFQFLKLFGGDQELLAAIVIPGVVMTLLFLMPFLGRWKLGHRFNLGLLLVLGIGIAMLTYLAKHEDANNEEYQQAVVDGERDSERTVELVQGHGGAPPEGVLSLLRSDPKTQGPKLFTSRCASCHAHVPGEKDIDVDAQRNIPSRNPSAPNLFSFASRDWIRRLLDKDQIAKVHKNDQDEIVATPFFGNTAHIEGDMAGFVIEDLHDEDAWTPEQVEDVVIALSAEAKLRSQQTMDVQDQNRIEAGRVLLMDEDRCAACHKFHGAGELGSAPDLTGYGSRDWLIGFISDPTQERFYGENNDRMRSYFKNPEKPRDNILPLKDVEMMADWLRGEWYEPDTTEEASGKSPEAAAEKPAEPEEEPAKP